MAEQACRCGYTGEGEHPCHGRLHGCGQPAKRRFYNPHFAPLAGAQMKLGVSETWACDACWEQFNANKLKEE